MPKVATRVMAIVVIQSPRIKVFAFNIGIRKLDERSVYHTTDAWFSENLVREYIDEVTLAATPISPDAELRPVT